MELRHLRYFLAVAEELNFTRAAARLHIEQSPLSRAIKELESELGIQLFERNPRGVQLTWAGSVFLDNVKRIFAALEQARMDMRDVALGFRGTLRIAVSDGIAPNHLADLLARCRQEEPELGIRLFEVSYAQQVKGLLEHHYDLGFARIDAADSGLQAQPVWSDPLVAALPTRHPLLSHRRIPLQELVRHPLILSHSGVHEGQFQQISRLLRAHLSEDEAARLNIAEQYISRETMQALVVAGYGVALVSGTERSDLAGSEIVTRALSLPDSELTTYLLRPTGEPSAHLSRFLERVAQTCRHTEEPSPQSLFDSLRPLAPLTRLRPVGLHQAHDSRSVS
ncbi:LysR family transcriptional regulator [Pseudomonas aeruginosa]|uniref:LysR family transcriptional regulator n=1 Tax=Pseudomonas aeruginosa TaxID=287 RepID=UPI000FC435C1|nr:LysR family transcriptional regulator [Pseudomonas aeruginosa]RUI25688.1 LysR family transcriptional regulator [Pseudomonas aeruginosa]